jgi:hypothetical protein
LDLEPLLKRRRNGGSCAESARAPRGAASRKRCLQLSLKPLVCLPMSQSVPKKKKAVILGVGFDSDGHKRVTTGENFALVGGSKETHDAMTEKAIKINEKLAAKGKRLEDVGRDEFDDIAHSVGLVRNSPDAN